MAWAACNLNYAYLHLDNGDLEHAESSAKTAFRLGEEKHDYILMARARLLLCMIENARVEEGIGESTEAGNHARLAQDCRSTKPSNWQDTPRTGVCSPIPTSGRA